MSQKDPSRQNDFVIQTYENVGPTDPYLSYKKNLSSRICAGKVLKFPSQLVDSRTTWSMCERGARNETKRQPYKVRAKQTSRQVDKGLYVDLENKEG